jgi:peroxiredoxin
VPDVPVLTTDGTRVRLPELTRNGKYVVVGIPGAFTPVCSAVAARPRMTPSYAALWSH